MTTISAGAAAGLIVALMVVATTDSNSAERAALAKDGATQMRPDDARGFGALQASTADAIRVATR